MARKKRRETTVNHRGTGVRTRRALTCVEKVPDGKNRERNTLKKKSAERDPKTETANTTEVAGKRETARKVEADTKPKGHWGIEVMGVYDRTGEVLRGG